MKTFDTLYSRRSVRSYTGESATDAELREILKAAFAAPVGRARYDTLHLTVITDKDYLVRWEDACGGSPFYGAPTVILVSSEMAGTPEQDNVRYAIKESNTARPGRLFPAKIPLCRLTYAGMPALQNEILSRNYLDRGSLK